MADEPVIATESIDEEVAWLEKRLADQDKQLSSMTALLARLVEKSETTNAPVQLTAEQMETLKTLLETTTGKTAEKLEAILLNLEKPSEYPSAGPSTSNLPTSSSPNLNGSGQDGSQSQTPPRKQRQPTSYRSI